MAFYLNIFSPQTWHDFRTHGGTVTGFPEEMLDQAERNISQGDIFLCWLKELSRWCGALRVVTDAYLDDSPIFLGEDPFPARLGVQPIVMLDPELAIPINAETMQGLTLMETRTGSSMPRWRGFVRQSPRKMEDDDGYILLDLLRKQENLRKEYPLRPQDRRALNRVRDSIISKAQRRRANRKNSDTRQARSLYNYFIHD